MTRTSPAARGAEAARPMTEKALQVHVLDAAKKLGWLCYHSWISVNSASGFPDLICIHEETGRMLAVELKRDGKEPTTAQHRWLVAFAGVPGVECYVWKPADWNDGTIVKVLR